MRILDLYRVRIMGLGLALPIDADMEGLVPPAEAGMMGVEPEPILTPQMQAAERTMAGVIEIHFQCLRENLEAAKKAVEVRLYQMAGEVGVLPVPVQSAGEARTLCASFSIRALGDPELLALLEKREMLKRQYALAKRVLDKSDAG